MLDLMRACHTRSLLLASCCLAPGASVQGQLLLYQLICGVWLQDGQQQVLFCLLVESCLEASGHVENPQGN